MGLRDALGERGSQAVPLHQQSWERLRELLGHPAKYDAVGVRSSVVTSQRRARRGAVLGSQSSPRLHEAANKGALLVRNGRPSPLKGLITKPLALFRDVREAAVRPTGDDETCVAETRWLSRRVAVQQELSRFVRDANAVREAPSGRERF